MKNKLFEVFVCMLLIGTFFVVTLDKVSAVDLVEGDYTYTLSNGEANITGYTGAGGAITIPSTLGGYPTVHIRDNAFYSNTNLTSVIIPDSVITIGVAAFYSCTLLKSVTIGNGVTIIGYQAFRYCGLTTVTIGSSVTTIGMYAFNWCSSLTSIRFLGLAAPTTISGYWISGTPAEIRGHAYTVSDFPAPGGIWNGLTMGTYINGTYVPKNNPPVFGAPSPATGSIGNQLSLIWSIPISDPEGNLFSWTIQCNNTQTNSATGTANGTKSLSLSDLAYSTVYKVWVNATDATGNGLYTREWYTFGVGAVGDWFEMQKLLASDPKSDSSFGDSVSISGDTALIGAPYDDNNGSAYVFTRTGTTWTQQAKLRASDGANGFKFGYNSVSIDGDTALIGASGYEGKPVNPRASYVFTRNGTTWTQQAKLLASDGTPYDWFGYSVSLDGNTALIGAYEDDDNGAMSGSAYVFTRTGTTWTQQAKLLASDGAASDNFGYSVSLNNDTALIGARADNDNGQFSGSVYVFTRTGNTWVQQQKLLASDGSAGDNFGYSVFLSGDTALIGAFGDDDNGVDSGSAYVFTRTGTTWTQQAKLLASDGAAGDRFGCSFAVSGDTTLIGAKYDGDNGNESGSAYVFTRTGTTWTQEYKLLASDGAAADTFGDSVSLSGDTALIGAHGSDFDKGAGYIFTKGGENKPPVADFTWAPSTPKTNQTITFDTSASNDTDGYLTLYEWDWNNDGVYEDSHTTPTAVHSWTQAGDYPVTVRITDNGGATSTKTITIPISSGGGNGNTNKKGTPGFELVFVLGAIAISLMLWKKKRDR